MHSSVLYQISLFMYNSVLNIAHTVMVLTDTVMQALNKRAEFPFFNITTKMFKYYYFFIMKDY